MNEEKKKPTILIYDAFTGEQTTRDMTDEEIAAIDYCLPDYLPNAE